MGASSAITRALRPILMALPLSIGASSPIVRALPPVMRAFPRVMRALLL
jgi:hypothetical protein